MKKLNLTPGTRIPLWGKDILFMQDSEREAFAAVLNGLVLDRQNYLVCGCDITVNDNTHKVSMTSGWCFYQGELLPVKALQATSFTGNRPLVKLTKVTEYVAPAANESR